MLISFIGHSTFLIENRKIKLLTDPGKFLLGGLTRKNLLEKITHISISHNHFDHSFTRDFSSDVQIISNCDPFEDNNLKIWGFKTFHDNCGGYKRGENIIYKYLIDGITLCHLGDLGHLLHNDLIDSLGNIDILFIPVGGNITINAAAAVNVVKKLQPKIILPMHYKSESIAFPIDGLEKFLYKISLPIKHKKSLEINSNDLKEIQNHVVVLNKEPSNKSSSNK